MTACLLLETSNCVLNVSELCGHSKHLAVGTLTVFNLAHAPALYLIVCIVQDNHTTDDMRFLWLTLITSMIVVLFRTREALKICRLAWNTRTNKFY